MTSDIKGIVCRILKRCKRKKQEEELHLASMYGAFEIGTWPRKFSYGELVSATTNFSNDKKLGKEGLVASTKGT